MPIILHEIRNSDDVGFVAPSLFVNYAVLWTLARACLEGNHSQNSLWNHRRVSLSSSKVEASYWIAKTVSMKFPLIAVDGSKRKEVTATGQCTSVHLFKRTPFASPTCSFVCNHMESATIWPLVFFFCNHSLCSLLYSSNYDCIFLIPEIPAAAFRCS
jgi:hypothetical protein